MTIDEGARRIGGLVWAERRLFELTGGWVATTPEPEPKVTLAVSSRRFGDHAVALAVLLPDTRDHTPEAMVAPVGDAAAAFDLAQGATTTPERLAVLSDALSAGHLAALEEYLADAVPVRDGPGIRVVTAVLAEDRAVFERLRDLSGI